MSAGYSVKPTYPLFRHEAAGVELTCSSCDHVFVIYGIPTPGDLEDPVCHSCRHADEKAQSWKS